MELDVGRIQMNFIHLLSTEAVQHITIQCLNTPVWAEGPSLQPSDKAVSFRAWTGERIQAGDLLEPLIPRDDCWVWVLIYWWRIDIVKLRHLSPICVSQKPCFYLYFGCKLSEGGTERFDPSSCQGVSGTPDFGPQNGYFHWHFLFVFLTFRWEMATGTRPTSSSRPRTRTYSP